MLGNELEYLNPVVSL